MRVCVPERECVREMRHRGRVGGRERDIENGVELRKRERESVCVKAR